METPLSRVMPCPAPDCGHDHLHLPCDFCPCDAQVIPGVYPDLEESPCC